MDQCPSEGNGFSPSEEIPRILWNPNIPPILSQISPVHAPPSLFWRSSLILSSHWCLNLPSGIFPSGFPTKTRFAHLPRMYYMPRPSYFSRFDHLNNMWWAVQIIKLLVKRFSAPPFYLVPPTPKYSSQYPVLQHPHPTLFPHCERPSFTPIQNNRQNYSSVYLNLYIFG